MFHKNAVTGELCCTACGKPAHAHSNAEIKKCFPNASTFQKRADGEFYCMLCNKLAREHSAEEVRKCAPEAVRTITKMALPIQCLTSRSHTIRKLENVRGNKKGQQGSLPSSGLARGNGNRKPLQELIRPV